jgi:hypothetical protein
MISNMNHVEIASIAILEIFARDHHTGGDIKWQIPRHN